MLTAALHPSCISARPGLRSGYLVYSELVQTDVLWIRDASPVAPVALWLFGGRLAFDAKAGLVTLDDGWIRFKVGAETAAAVLQLRQQLDALLAQKVAHPDTDLSRAGAALIDGVTRLMGGVGAAAAAAKRSRARCSRCTVLSASNWRARVACTLHTATFTPAQACVVRRASCAHAPVGAASCLRAVAYSPQLAMPDDFACALNAAAPLVQNLFEIAFEWAHTRSKGAPVTGKSSRMDLRL